MDTTMPCGRRGEEMEPGRAGVQSTGMGRFISGMSCEHLLFRSDAGERVIVLPNDFVTCAYRCDARGLTCVVDGGRPGRV